MPEEALLDAVDDQLDTQTDDSTQVDDTSTDSSDTSTQTDTQDESPVISDENGRLVLSQTAKAELDRIKAENPRLAREMRAALFDRQMLLSKIPGGVKEALETIEAYEADGGSEAFQQVNEELGLWKALDEDFQAGKPEFVNDIANGNPDAFIKLGPQVMSKLSEMAPELFSHEVSKVFSQDMAANDVMLTMKLLQREIAMVPEEHRGEIHKLWTQLAAYIDRVNNIARTQPKVESRNSGTQPGTDGDREQQLRIREFSSERQQVKEAITKSEFNKNAAGRKLSAEKIGTIGELYESALDRLVRSIPGHTAKVDRFLAAGDRAGYRRHMEAAIKSKAPQAMSQAFRRAGVGAKPGVKPGAKPAAQTAKPNVQATGFTRVGQKPDKNTVNWAGTKLLRRTPADEGKYLLWNGSRVLYQR